MSLNFVIQGIPYCTLEHVMLLKLHMLAWEAIRTSQEYYACDPDNVWYKSPTTFKRSMRVTLV